MADSNCITLQKSSKCSVKVHLYGATVISWTCNGDEQLFLSSTSKMDGSKAIRGGIPLVFPNFGPWEHGPQHGFARISWWEVKEKPQQLADGTMTTVLCLKDNDETRKSWNYRFALEYKLTLQDNNLVTELKINNTGSDQFDFTTLLHTYFRVSDITKTTISGFKNCLFIDKVAGTNDNKEDRDLIEIEKCVDSVYKNTSSNGGHKISSPQQCVSVTSHNLPDTVLWNPWVEKAAAMSDFDNEGYLKMVCVEAGYVAERKILKAGESFTCSQTLTIL